MELGMILTAIGTVIGIAAFVYGFLRNFKTDINTKFESLEKHIDRIDAQMVIQGKRTDHLYEICVELLRSKKEK
jgi:chaperonin cofactor prefoldin